MINKKLSRNRELFVIIFVVNWFIIMVKRIAIIISNADFIFAKNVGATFGGAAVVAKNIYETLKNDFCCDVHIYSKFASSGYDQDNVFKITEPIAKFVSSLQSMSYDKIITLSINSVYINQFLQVMSKHNSVRNSKFLIRLILKFLYRKKLNYQTSVYTNLPENASFIAVSELVKADYIKSFGIPESKVKVIYPGCSVKDKDKVSGITSGVIRLGIVANSSINKGGHFFLLAAGLAKLFGAKFEIVMIATKYNKDILMRFLISIFSMNSIVKVLPKQNDMCDFYNGIDCIVLPSQNEAFGLVALEGMSYGKIPLVSNTTGVSEIVTDNAGYVFERNNIITLVKAISKIARMYSENQEKFREMSNASYELSSNYTWKSFCERLLSE